MSWKPSGHGVHTIEPCGEYEPAADVRRECGCGVGNGACSDACGHKKIRHGDHFDYLVEKPDGTKELHRPYTEGGVQKCAIHGVLRPEEHEIGPWRNYFTFEPMKQLVQVMRAGHASGSEIRTTMFVEGICCPSEIPIIEKLLKPLPGVKTVAVNVPNRTTTVDHRVPRPTTMRNAVPARRYRLPTRSPRGDLNARSWFIFWFETGED